MTINYNKTITGNQTLELTGSEDVKNCTNCQKDTNHNEETSFIYSKLQNHLTNVCIVWFYELANWQAEYETAIFQATSAITT